MKVSRIEVTPHARSPIGSFAVIRLVGISRLDGPATFSLEPLTVAGHMPPAGWPLGDLRPLGIRAGSGAVELLIGPEVVKAGPLTPGTHVRFVMPSAGADTRLVWPDLTGDAANPADRRPAHSSVMSAVEGGSAPQSAGSTQPPQPSLPNPPVASVNDNLQGLARLQPRGAPAHVSHPTAPSVRPPQAPAPEVHPIVSEGAAPATEGLRERSEAQPALVSERRSTPWLPMALSFIIVAALLIALTRIIAVDGSGITLFSVLRSALTGPQSSAPVRVNSHLALGEILEVGDLSPSGVDASGMTRREALERANELLRSIKTPADRLEVAFWLRKALSSSLSEPRLVWAVTQLGTAYASTDEKDKPNYEAARLLWAWAADAGDAQAACFLGRLYEQGLGVPASVKMAHGYYQRARRLGGCPGLDQAMLRVKPQQ